VLIFARKKYGLYYLSLRKMLKITPFEPHYTEQITALILGIQQGEFQVPITLEQQPDLLIIDRFYQKDRGNFWVALHGDEVVGTIALIDCGAEVGCIRKMFVKAAYRGKELGIAQQLLNQLVAWCQEHGISSLYLGTIERLQAAIRFYERNDFRLIPKAELPPTFPIMAVDTHFFEKKM
jgi:putative acetyltransferase